MRSDIPYPPLELAERVGALDDAEDPWELYEGVGRASMEGLLAALPDGYQLDGCRVLDFGCGAGRTLRHFVAAGNPAELWGCDIDATSIEWLKESLSPPVHPFVSRERPPLAVPDGMFDLVYCVSVFTHLSQSWSAWLVELHRVLRPDGLLLASFMGEGEFEAVTGEAWDEDSIGMMTMNLDQEWCDGGPTILHSPWWIGEHWGRLFEIVSFAPSGFPGREPGTGQGLVAMRRKETTMTPAELEELSDDTREATALARSVNRSLRELATLAASSPPGASA